MAIFFFSEAFPKILCWNPLLFSVPMCPLKQMCFSTQFLTCRKQLVFVLQDARGSSWAKSAVQRIFLLALKSERLLFYAPSISCHIFILKLALKLSNSLELEQENEPRVIIRTKNFSFIKSCLAVQSRIFSKMRVKCSLILVSIFEFSR